MYFYIFTTWVMFADIFINFILYITEKKYNIDTSGYQPRSERLAQASIKDVQDPVTETVAVVDMDITTISVIDTEKKNVPGDRDIPENIPEDRGGVDAEMNVPDSGDISENIPGDKENGGTANTLITVEEKGILEQ